MIGKAEIELTEQQDRFLGAYIGLSKNASIWSGDIQSALDVVTYTCANLLQVDRVSVWWLNPDLTSMYCVALHQLNAVAYTDELDLVEVPEYINALRDVRSIESSDAKHDERLVGIWPYLLSRNIDALLDTSILIEGQLKAILSLEVVGATRSWSQSEKSFITSVADLIGHVYAVAALRDSQSKYKALFDGAGDAIFVMRDGYFFDCNTAAELMFGVSAAEFKKLVPADISPPQQPDGSDSMARSIELMQLAVRTPQRFEWQHQRVNGPLFYAEVILKSIQLGNDTCLIAMVRDVTERKRSETLLEASRRELEHRVNHDSLTALPNRHYLHQFIDDQLAMADSLFALLLLDLNQFKEINDTLGHQFGDKMLQDIASDLTALLQAQRATLFRLGGDEFAIVLSGQLTDVLPVADLIHRQLQQPRRVDQIKLQVTGSIGVACYPAHGRGSHQLLRSADVAMYQAKTQGVSTVVYDPGFDSHTIERLELLSELSDAIKQNQLQLHYQPKIDLQTGKCIGCEALLRWQHPVKGMIPPGQFIDVAEKSDIIHVLTQWVIAQAVWQSHQWQLAGLTMPIAINLSARNLVDLSCPQQLSALLQQFAVPADLIEIEITESSLISDPQRALDVVNLFCELGLQLSIDDFGTGYSSLSYLKKLPVKKLKIDRSFVSDMLTNAADEMIVRSTIALAHSFGLLVVAEGVENAQTYRRLSELGCDQAQGYFMSRPLAAEQFVHWLHEQHPAE